MQATSHDRERPVTPQRFLMLGWLCSAAILAYVHRNSPGAAESSIRTDLNLSLEEMGLVISSFFWSYAIFQIPSGWLADHWGTRRLLSLIALIWTAATAALALASGFFSLLTWRFIGGAAQAGIFSCATRSISHWFPISERGMTSGFLGGFMSAGGALGAMATGILLHAMNWRWILLLLALPGVIWTVLFHISFRDRPPQDTYDGDETRSFVGDPPGGQPCTTSTNKADTVGSFETEQDSGLWSNIARAPAIWWLSAQQFFRAAAYIFYASWFATYLQETRDVSKDHAAFLTSVPLWAVVLGSPIGGIVSDWVFSRTGSRRVARSGVAAASMLACAALILSAYFVSNDWLAVSVISLGSFCSAIGGPCAYAATIDVGGSRVATVFSIMNMCGNVGAAVFPMIVPKLVLWSGSWDLVLVLFSGLYVAAGACWMLVNPNDSVFRSAAA